MSEQNTPRSVSVVGLGPMGQSMVRALLDPGVEVRGWNRSTDKVVPMVEHRAHRAETVAAALAALEVTVL
ncbi:NAD(P)-binding domain-containing protein, partial [Nocardia brasiliensis]|uniref:NAD(P)-binding domain-containing protein n=1 Tax=Nocardia brasiliensis TaxID=37326 RepID=UPI002455A27C